MKPHSTTACSAYRNRRLSLSWSALSDGRGVLLPVVRESYHRVTGTPEPETGAGIDGQFYRMFVQAYVAPHRVAIRGMSFHVVPGLRKWIARELRGHWRYEAGLVAFVDPHDAERFRANQPG